MKKKLVPSSPQNPLKTSKTRKKAGFGVSDTCIDTEFDTFLRMSDKKNKYISAKLYPSKERKGARYHIKFAAFDEKIGRLRVKKIWIPAEYKTDKEKRAKAAIWIAQINKDLEDGKCFKDENNTPETCKKNAPISLIVALKKQIETKKTELRKKSASTYQYALSGFLAFLEANKLNMLLVIEFNRAKVFEFRTYLKVVKGCSNRTANNNIGLVGSLFEMLKDRDIIELNPFSKIKPLPEIDSEANTAFTLDHQIALENWIKENDPMLFLFTRFIYYAFIRPKELRQLKGTDINLVSKTITVRGTIAKNKKTQTIPINYKLLEAIGAKISTLPNKYLFGSRLEFLSGFPMSENYAYNRHKKALLACGLTGLNYTLYSWKHTGACRAIEAGVNPRKLQGLLRHSSLSETDTYLRSLGISLQNEELKEIW